MPTFANNLLSMGVFCNAGCTVVFTREEVNVTNSASIKIMQGWRESDGAHMWRFNLTNATAMYDSSNIVERGGRVDRRRWAITMVA
jgi:hypothetical protein